MKTKIEAMAELQALYDILKFKLETTIRVNFKKAWKSGKSYKPIEKDQKR